MRSELRDLPRYREMLFGIVRRELRGRYRGSLLGFLWTFLNPLLMLLVYTLVFSVVLRASVPQYSFSLYLFTGLLPWLFLSGSLLSSTTLVRSNANLIKKIRFPRLVLPIALVATNLANLLLSVPILAAGMLLERVPATWTMLYALPLLAVLSVFALGATMLLSALAVPFRDLEHILSIVVTAWFYLTPIVYTLDLVPEALRPWFALNPLAPLIAGFQDCLLYGRAPAWGGLLYACVAAGALLVAGYFTYDRLQRRFAEDL